MFKDRKDAGLSLVQFLKENQVEFDVVMAIPRGGVLVAEVVAEAFAKPMDVVMVKKLGSPNLPDYALGAVSPDGEIIRHQYTFENLMDMDPEMIDKLAAKVMIDINRRLNIFRSYRPPVSVKGKTVLLVDDGIASGFTIKAAGGYLRRQEASQVIVAVPVCSYNAYLISCEAVDKIQSLIVPRDFYAVSQFYEDFTAVEDSDVIEALQRLNHEKNSIPAYQDCYDAG